MKKGAIIRDGGKYRYLLWRIWNNYLPLVLWVMLNPSTADECEDDPTIRRIIRFSKDWGFGGINVCNLSPYRCTDPKQLKGIPRGVLIPGDNISYMRDAASQCSLHVLAYGNPPFPFQKRLLNAIPVQWHYLKLTVHGNPMHPLYLKADLKPQQIILL